MFTAGGGAPQETLDEIANKLGTKVVTESRGHGIIVEARHYDHFLGADAGRSLVAQGRGPAGSYNFFQSAETGPGRLARNADTVRKLGQVGQTAVPAQGVVDTLGQALTDEKAKVDQAFEGAKSGAEKKLSDAHAAAAAEQATAAQGVGEKTAQAKLDAQAALLKKQDAVAQALEDRQAEIAAGLSAARESNKQTLANTLQTAAPNAAEPEELAPLANTALNDAEKAAEEVVISKIRTLRG